MINRKNEIKNKGFQMSFEDSMPETNNTQNPFVPIDFSKIKIGAKELKDAILNLGDYNKVDQNFAKKESVLKALYNRNCVEMREISNFYFQTSGIYSRLCKYMAYMYRYD